VHPVVGKVTYKGEPLADALVSLHRQPTGGASPGSAGSSAESVPTPTGTTDSNGVFKIHTYVGADGAPVGDYRVTVVMGRPTDARNLMVKSTSKPTNVTLPSKYADATTSGLVATVKEGDNTLPTYALP
jgi:hypothetical protein